MSAMQSFERHGRLLVQARDQPIFHAVLRGDTFLTRPEGEWW
jgi:hypothetical protein